MKFSIITPTLNQGQYIESTINSVLGQRVVDLEYIVIDGGSKDDTLKILKKYKNRLVYVSEKDSGQSTAINKGFRTSSGDILAWINSDDEYLPEALSKVEQYFINNPDCEMVYGDYWLKNSQDVVFAKVKEIDFDKNIFLSGVNFICQPTVFFRRELWEKLGDFDENMHYAFDAAWWMRVMKSGFKIGHMRDYLAVVRLHDKCKTIKNNVEMVEELKNMFGISIKKLYYRVIRQLLRLINRGQINIIPLNLRREWR